MKIASIVLPVAFVVTSCSQKKDNVSIPQVTSTSSSSATSSTSSTTSVSSVFPPPVPGVYNGFFKLDTDSYAVTGAVCAANPNGAPYYRMVSYLGDDDPDFMELTVDINGIPPDGVYKDAHYDSGYNGTASLARIVCMVNGQLYNGRRSVGSVIFSTINGRKEARLSNMTVMRGTNTQDTFTVGGLLREE